jgi:hypothetical protein
MVRSAASPGLQPEVPATESARNYLRAALQVSPTTAWQNERVTYSPFLDRSQGYPFGLAIGNAFGAPLEGLSSYTVQRQLDPPMELPEHLPPPVCTNSMTRKR